MDFSIPSFAYAGDETTRGARWTAWLCRFRLYLVAKSINSGEKAKALFLLLIGEEAMSVYLSTTQNRDMMTLKDMYEHMSKQSVTTTSKFTAGKVRAGDGLRLQRP